MENVDFTIKRGDRSPNISAVLKDKNGSPVDLTGKTVQFKMRSFNSGALLVDQPAAVVAPGTDGRVQYVWQAGDTDNAGYSFAEWEVVLSPGPPAVKQTFPTQGWHLIDIASDLDDPSIDDQMFVDIRSLRRMVAENTRENYSDSLLTAMLLSNDSDLTLTAAQIWREKAAEYASLVDTSESGSSRKMSQLYDRAVKQAGIYESAGGIVAEVATARPRIGRIVRQP